MFRGVILLLCLLLINVHAAGQELPSLGDRSSGIISLNEERKLGQQFLRSIRAQAPTLDDAILQDYLEYLVYKLASNSQLKDKRLDLVLIENNAFNAFAAPGGIIGIHHGLFKHIETEHELSAILSHEIAHLSQRHFARQLVMGKKSNVVSIAGLLAGILLATTTGSDAGLAVLTTSQAYGQSQYLKYSREREAEADRIGIQTLVESNMDPWAMAYSFERLQSASRHSGGERIPEFLRTHPVTRSRIADSYNQVRNYPKETFPLNLDYQLMRIRAQALTSKNPQQDRARFEAGPKVDNEVMRTANNYGLVLMLTKDLAFDEAKRLVTGLREAHPLNIPFRIAEAEIYEKAQQTKRALELLEDALDISTNNYPLSINLAEALIADRKPHAALEVLTPLSIGRPNDEYLWYLLAEAYGLANNIPGVHEARAEFFVLNGNFDQAIKQLGYALPLVRHNFQKSARIKQRLGDIWKLKGG